MKYLASRRFENYWPSMLTILMLAGFVGFTCSGLDWSKMVKTFGEGRKHSRQVGPDRPDVLLVSTQDSDRFTVAATVEPRGYKVLFADSAEAGMNQIRQQRDRIGYVVIDAALPLSAQLLRAAEAECPEAHSIMLDGAHQPGEVAVRLINQVVRF